jgi:hypothetical protein
MYMACFCVPYVILVLLQGVTIFRKKRSELQGDQMSLGKNRSKCSQNYFLPKLIHTQLLLLKKEDPK